MKINVNNQPHQISEDTAVSQLLLQLDVSSTKGIAIAVNNEVVPRTKWEDYRLNDGDDILLINATQGG